MYILCNIYTGSEAMEDWIEDMDTRISGNVQLVFGLMACGKTSLQNLVVFQEASREISPWWWCEGSLMMILAQDKQRLGTMPWMGGWEVSMISLLSSPLSFIIYCRRRDFFVILFSPFVDHWHWINDFCWCVFWVLQMETPRQRVNYN